MAGAEIVGKGENIIREREVGGAERGGKGVITVLSGVSLVFSTFFVSTFIQY